MSQNFAKGIPSVPTGPASGDLSGNYPSPTVSALQTNPVHAGTLTSLNDGYVLTWDNTDGYWHASPIISSSIILSGDVTGPGNANTVVSITGASGVINVASTGNIITWNSATTAPGLKQANLATNSGTGATMTIQAQNETGTTSTGGTLNLTSGTGTTAAGSLHLQTGGTTRLTANATGVITVANLGTGVVHADSSGNLTSSTIINADVSATAAIAVTKLAHGTDAQILLTNGTTPTWTTQSGDVSLLDTGVTTVNAISGSTPIVITPTEFQWAAATSSPLLDQASLGTAATYGSAGQTFSITAQKGQDGGGGPYTGGAGGNIAITGGIGGAAGGTVTNATGGNVTISTGAAGTGGIGGSTGSFVVKTGSTTQMTATSSGITVSNLAGSGSGYVAVNNAGLLSFTSGVAPSGSAGGDLSGTYPNPTVAKINGTSVTAGGSLTTGNGLYVTGSSALSYSALNLAGGSNYVTGALPTANQVSQSLTLTGDTTGSGTTAGTTTTTVKINGSSVPAGGSLTTGNVLQVSGASALTYAALNLAGGSHYVTGNLPISNIAPGTSAQILMSNGTPATTWTTMSGDVTITGAGVTTVGQLQGSIVLSGTPSSGQVLTATSSTAAHWASDPATVTWANDLAGSTNTNQYVAAISGNAGAGGTIPFNATTLNINSAAITPAINQANAAASTNATSLSISAQSAVTTIFTGGDLNLSSGSSPSGAAYYGNINLQPGGVPTAVIGSGTINFASVLGTPAWGQQVTSGSTSSMVFEAQSTTSTTASGGSLTILGGFANLSSGAGGPVQVQGGASHSGTGGTVTIYGGQSSSGTTGAVNIQTNTGTVNILTGSTLLNRFNVNSSGTVQIPTFGTGIVHSDSSGNLTSSAVVATDITAGTSGQVLMSNATPTTTWTTFSQDATVSATGAITVKGLQTNAVHADTLGAAQDGYILSWQNSGPYWTAKIAPSGSFTAGGDLSGSSSSQTVVGVRGISVPSPSGTNTVLTYNAGALSWGAGGGGGGGLTAPVVGTTVTKTGNYTITTSDYIIFADTSGGAFNLTLPAPVNGNIYVVKDIKGTFEANNITLVRHASEKIEGIAASRALTTNWGSFTVTSNGTDWFLLD